MSSLRFPLAVIFGLLLNGGMFYVLYKLTTVTFNIEVRQATHIEFTRMKRDTEVQTRREEKVERQPPPPTPEVPSVSAAASNVGGVTVTLAPKIDTKSALSGIKVSGGSDRDVVPLVRINPEYPQRALNRGIEGWVTVQFTITETGSVADAVVVDASPKGMFDEAALKAIAKWRYNPKVEDGVAVARKGIQTMLRFQLEN
ncbi:MAG TPA: energy transducer TonB [Candidatus Acidoferrum sp.]|nr:energy transducer TonB [Candidatus Acidoferrum sp.]